jgi:excinuclease ABC subunit A
MALTHKIEILGAREHNLKNIDLSIPAGKLVVFTGLSGSGKSSLAFDTLFAEGQRRYMETFSSYARQFIGGMQRPDVDKVNGLSPVVAIEQKTVSKNPRSTVGTITEVYDFLRLLYARTADAYSYNTGEKMVRFNEDQVLQLIEEKFHLQNVHLLAPLIRARKGHYRELFETLHKQGYKKVRIDGHIQELQQGLKLDRYKVHDIELQVDRIQPGATNKTRLRESLKLAFKLGKGTVSIWEPESAQSYYFSKNLMDPLTGLSYDEPQPNTFSFNSPYGACPKCNGIGVTHAVKIEEIIPDNSKSIARGAILPLGELRENYVFAQLKALANKYKFSLSEPISKLSEKVMEILLHGTADEFKVSYTNYEGRKVEVYTAFKGVIPIIEDMYYENKSESLIQWAEEFMQPEACHECEGTRLKKEAMWYKIGNKNIAQLAQMNIRELENWINELPSLMSERQIEIGSEVLKEIRERLSFLTGVGLEYLSLNSPAATLSGGEAQRIRLATQIGSKLVNVLYILDEPSIGLHQRDNEKLIQSLKDLRDLGNSVIVVEHDMDMIRQADYVVDIGPGAGINGGEIVAEGTPEEFCRQNSLTADYLSGKKEIAVPKSRRKINKKKLIQIKGCKGNNLKNVNLELPLGVLTCITGVSGSGKSTLINETLYPVLSQAKYGSRKKPLPFDAVNGIEHIDKVIRIDQNPIGRTPRSNPATYTGLFTEIRNLFAAIPEAQIRGYKPGRFSFNVKGGRCETCKGGGATVIEMNFLPDVEVLCTGCLGRRYSRETLEVKYKGKTISDVLNMSINEAVIFFEPIPTIARKVAMLQQVGLGYIKLGQSSTTLSGGEAQRVKLSEELSKKDTGSTLYILDEPTTGLHFEDVKMLLEVLQKLVEKGNTVVVIEHNLDVIKVADYIIDVGPEGGVGGGNIVASGTPEEIVANNVGYTSVFLAPYLPKTISKVKTKQNKK